MELDISAFEALFKLHYSSLCLTAIRITGDKAIAEDMVQEVFLQVWKKRETIQIESSLKAYLHKSVIHQSLNYHRQQKALIERQQIHFLDRDEDINPIEQQIFSKDTQTKIDQVINCLPEGCRRVFVLSRFEQMSYKQIASTLNISVKTVENQMVKALKVLRAHLLVLIFIFFLNA